MENIPDTQESAALLKLIPSGEFHSPYFASEEQETSPTKPWLFLLPLGLERHWSGGRLCIEGPFKGQTWAQHCNYTTLAVPRVDQIQLISPSLKVGFSENCLGRCAEVYNYPL
jgi:hypothetical protein